MSGILLYDHGDGRWAIYTGNGMARPLRAGDLIRIRDHRSGEMVFTRLEWRPCSNGGEYVTSDAVLLYPGCTAELILGGKP